MCGLSEVVVQEEGPMIKGKVLCEALVALALSLVGLSHQVVPNGHLSVDGLLTDREFDIRDT